MDKNKEDFVNVALRIRPVISQDSTASSCLQVISNQPPLLIVLDRAQTYHFDNIFVEDIDQETVYNETVKPLVKNVKEGYNCTIFAYGQTGTGKTYTMGTNPHVKNSKDKGLIPRALEEFFTITEFNEDVETHISVSFIEIYNEKVFDLLRPNSKEPLPVKGFNVPGVCIESVHSSIDAKSILEFGNKNRHTAETKQNSNSSRSHAVFTVICNIRTRDSETTAKLNLVDLAGSESVKKTGNQGNTFTEGININKGLLSIGQVVKALTTDASFVPYRQSIITSILQDSLNKNNFVSLIACVNSNPEDIVETIQSLNFASEVKKMKNRPEVNDILAQYKKANPGLFRGLGTPYKRPSSTPFKTPCLKKVKSSIVPSLNMIADTPLNTEFGAPLCSVNQPQSMASSSPKSLLSASISSVGHNCFMQQTLSPVIKKYMSQMESALMSRLETVIKDTIQRPRRSPLRGKENIHDSQLGHWEDVRKEISNLVQQEISMLSVKPPKATSSPLELSEEVHVRRTLKYGSPDPQEDNSENQSFEFKKPTAVLKLKRKPTNLRKTLSMSPIEVNENDAQPPKSVRRRSVRLSLKNNVNENDVSVMCIGSRKHAPKNSRQSVILTSKNLVNESESEISQVSPHEISKNKSPKTCRKSVRLSLKRDMINNPNDTSISDFDTSVCKSIKVKKTKTVNNKHLTRVRNQGKSKGSPHTNHRRRVLQILNKGTANEIANLHTIGMKTAGQIILFRELKGEFRTINGLSNIPGWGVKKYQRFITTNFLE